MKHTKNVLLINNSERAKKRNPRLFFSGVTKHVPNSTHKISSTVVQAKLFFKCVSCWDFFS